MVLSWTSSLVVAGRRVASATAHIFLFGARARALESCACIMASRRSPRAGTHAGRRGEPQALGHKRSALLLFGIAYDEAARPEFAIDFRYSVQNYKDTLINGFLAANGRAVDVFLCAREASERVTRALLGAWKPLRHHLTSDVTPPAIARNGHLLAVLNRNVRLVGVIRLCLEAARERTYELVVITRFDLVFTLPLRFLSIDPEAFNVATHLARNRALHRPSTPATSGRRFTQVTRVDRALAIRRDRRQPLRPAVSAPSTAPRSHDHAHRGQRDVRRVHRRFHEIDDSNNNNNHNRRSGADLGARDQRAPRAHRRPRELHHGPVAAHVLLEPVSAHARALQAAARPQQGVVCMWRSNLHHACSYPVLTPRGTWLRSPHGQRSRERPARSRHIWPGASVWKLRRRAKIQAAVGARAAPCRAARLQREPRPLCAARAIGGPHYKW